MYIAASQTLIHNYAYIEGTQISIPLIGMIILPSTAYNAGDLTHTIT